ncbi:MAG: HAMP domain-containing sensor histidine kinase [Spirochaetales bacterium]|nr:HAMP domain-containing sensor histidine kinase [Spirochaetales bacterium]
MKIRIKLASLILCNGLSFLLAFLIYLIVSSFVEDIEWEKNELMSLRAKAQVVRITGAEIFVNQPFEESWFALETEMRNLAVSYHYIDSLTVLPSLTPQLEHAISTIMNLETLIVKQFEVLSQDYQEISNVLSGTTISSTVQFTTLYNRPLFVDEEDWVLLHYLADLFRTEYSLFDDALANSVHILEEEMYFIESEARRVIRAGLTLSLVLSMLIAATLLVISLFISGRIARDMVRIDNSLSQMLSSSEKIVIPVERNDELGELARNIESIFNELIDTKDYLIQSEKMASLGELVAGVAHEINTPIGIGVTASSHIIHRIDEINTLFADENLTRDEFIESMGMIKESSQILLSNMEKAAALIKGFKQVAVDRSHLEARRFNASDFLDDLMQSLLPLYNKTAIEIDVDCSDVLEINSVPGILSQVLTNLIQNSILHGFPDNGTGHISISLERSGNHLILRYLDDGLGMTEEIRSRIFDPFFTTKRGSGGGSGLGLHLVYNLVTHGLNGTVSCKSRPGEGAEFLISFKETF